MILLVLLPLLWVGLFQCLDFFSARSDGPILLLLWPIFVPLHVWFVCPILFTDYLRTRFVLLHIVKLSFIRSMSASGIGSMVVLLVFFHILIRRVATSASISSSSVLAATIHNLMDEGGERYR